jgi:hypothetical protein
MSIVAQLPEPQERVATPAGPPERTEPVLPKLWLQDDIILTTSLDPQSGHRSSAFSRAMIMRSKTRPQASQLNSYMGMFISSSFLSVILLLEPVKPGSTS